MKMIICTLHSLRIGECSHRRQYLKKINFRIITHLKSTPQQCSLYLARCHQTQLSALLWRWSRMHWRRRDLLRSNWNVDRMQHNELIDWGGWTANILNLKFYCNQQTNKQDIKTALIKLEKQVLQATWRSRHQSRWRQQERRQLRRRFSGCLWIRPPAPPPPQCPCSHISSSLQN